MIPNGKKGVWEIQNHNGMTILLKNSKPYLDNTYFDCIGDLSRLTGKVLCSGLGLGFIIEHLVKKPEIESITCIEISQDLIDLVWEHLEKNGKAEIICMDINDYLALNTFSYLDSVFIDIWYPNENGAREGIISVRSELEKSMEAERIVIWEERKFMDGVI